MEASEEPQAEVVPAEIKNEDKEVEEITLNEKGEEGNVKNAQVKENGDTICKEANKNGETATPERRMSLRARTTPKKYLEDQESDDDIREELICREKDPLAVEITRVSKSPNKLNSRSPRSSRPPPDLVKSSGMKSQISILPAISSNAMPRSRDSSGFVIVDTQSILTGKGPVALSSVPASITVSPVTTTRISSGKIVDVGERTTKLAPKPKPVDPFEQLGLADDSFIVEAPSFVVPYLIEKPAEGNLKKAVDGINKTGEEVIVLDEDESAEGKEKKNEEAAENKVEDKSSMKSEMQEYASEDYFSGAIGKFFLDIGLSLVQEYVQEDLLRIQKRKVQRGARVKDPNLSVEALEKGLEQTRAKNLPLKLKVHQCDRCNFRTDSAMVLAYHWVAPYQRGSIFYCHFCDFESREAQGAAHMVALHMEQEHGVRASVEPELNGHQCPLCPFEDSVRSKVTRHVMSCQKKFFPSRNLEPPREWEPPAKIPRVAPKLYNSMSSAYNLPNKVQMNYPLPSYHPLLPKSALLPSAALPGYAMLPNGQVTYVPRVLQNSKSSDRMLASAVQGSLAGLKLPTELQLVQNSRTSTPAGKSSSGYRSPAVSAGQSLYPYAVTGNQVYQQLLKGQNAAMSVIPSGSSSSPKPPPVATRKSNSNSVVVLPGRSNSATNPGASVRPRANQQPSISITPLPRPGGATVAASTKSSVSVGPVPGSVSAGKDNVVCEICDSVIKDLEQLRHHMQWIHKVKIHPKMIHNRPPLNCQKCQCRFFTDQGLERHLLGSHGLVTSSMQEAANKGQDGGRCPICGRVHQWKLLSHVVKDHGLTLKPAHLSYKCTVCTATFGMYKLFESHVYTAHSVVAKKVLDKNPKNPAGDSSGSSSSAPVRINDEITIIAQPNRGNGSECQNCHGTSDKCESCTRKRKVDVIDLIDDDENDGAGKDASACKSQVTITKVAGPAKNPTEQEPPTKRVRADE